MSSAWKLILPRCGLFDVDAYTDKTICPAHRYKLGLSWTSSRKCCHLLHKVKGKPFRGGNKATSREMFDRWGILITVGTGICRGCLSKHKQTVTHQTAEQLPPSDVLSKRNKKSSSVQSVISQYHLSNPPTQSALQFMSIHLSHHQLMEILQRM
ncbi:uncharacterized protein LOC119724464 [Patiria miniata]|uniref:Uncharacterized protein n=1 Tax=Patiria miniata TaxID=46514 RepID=A0A913ZI38_PATMI|nr:uncharacterized protein LOC119724464 [Patiria miniata]